MITMEGKLQPFELLQKNLDEIIEYMRNDFDYCLAISGRKRRGKSTLAYHIATHISAALGGKVWLCQNYKQLRDAMFKSKKYDVIFADETIGFLNNLKLGSAEAIEFIELFDRMGYKDLFIILIMPSFGNFIKGFREDRLDAHIWLPKRAIANVYAVQETKEGCSFPDRPTFSDSFPQLDPDVEKEYRTAKERAMKDRVKEMREFSYDPRGMLMRVNRWMRQEALLEQKERASIYGVSIRTIKRWDALDRKKGQGTE